MFFDEVICKNKEWKIMQHLKQFRGQWIQLNCFNDSTIYQYGFNIDRTDSINIDYSVVLYAQCKVTVIPTDNATLSFDFSGCYMASFKFNGQRYVAHIAYGDNYGRNAYLGATYWNQFITKNVENISEIRLFKPTEWVDQYQGIFKHVWGLITERGDCYAIRVYQDNYDDVMIDPNGIFRAYPIIWSHFNGDKKDLIKVMLKTN